MCLREKVVVSKCACVKSTDQDYGVTALLRWQSGGDKL